MKQLILFPPTRLKHNRHTLTFLTRILHFIKHTFYTKLNSQRIHIPRTR